MTKITPKIQEIFEEFAEDLIPENDQDAHEEEVKADIENMRKYISRTPYVCAFGYEMVHESDVERAIITADKKMYINKSVLKRDNEKKIAAHREETIRIMHEALGSGMWGMEFDEHGHINVVNWSPEFRKMIGYKDENDFPNKLESWSNLLHPDDKDKVLKEFYDTIADFSGTKNYDVEYRLKVKDGQWKWFHAIGRLLRPDPGHPLPQGQAEPERHARGGGPVHPGHLHARRIRGRRRSPRAGGHRQRRGGGQGGRRGHRQVPGRKGRALQGLRPGHHRLPHRRGHRAP